MDFINVFSFCKDFDDYPTSDFCHVHGFMDVDLLICRVSHSAEKVDKLVLSRMQLLNLLRLAQNRAYLVLRIY